MENPLKGDFVKIVKRDLEECRTKLTYDKIQRTPKKKLKELVRESIKKASFEYLMSEKTKLSKGKGLDYKQLKTQPYPLPGNNINIHDIRRILQLRIQDAPVRKNFANS